MRIGASIELFERWRDVAHSCPGELALVDLSSRREYTFEELFRASDQGAQSDGMVFPTGTGAEFLIELLQAWRNGFPTCPLEQGQAVPEIPLPKSTIAHLKLTSATGGVARCVAFTPAQLAADPANIVSTMGLRPEWPNLACISLTHSYGFSNLVLPLVLHGIPLLLAPAPLPETIRAAARLFPNITLPAVPALWRNWHQSDSIPANVRLAISAGAPLPVELENEIFEHRSLKIHNFYGSSECGGIAYDRSEQPRGRGDWVGTAMDNVVLSLSEQETLQVQSAAVAEGYWPVAEPGLRGGRFQSSDIATLAEGGVFLRGRLNDVINVAGRKAVPEVIEAALRQHPAVLECLVFGRREARHERFETIVACIHANRPVTIPELTAYLSAQLPTWQIPRQWWFTEELTPNARGKLSRAEWRKRYEARTTQSRSASP